MPNRSCVSRRFLVVLLACAAVTRCSRGGEGGTEIVLWENLVPHEAALLDECIERFRQAHPGIRISHTNFETERLRTQYITAVLGGGGPDLVYGPGDQVGPFSAAGAIRPVDDLLEVSFLAAFLPSAFDTLGGRLWAVPARVGNHLTLLYNRDLLDRPPETLEELLSFAEEGTRDLDGDGSPDRYGLVFNMKEPYWLVPFLGAFGGWIMDEKHLPTLDTPAMVEALRFVHELQEQRAMPAGADYEMADALFKEGKAAMLINGPWSWGGYREAGVDFGLATIPRCERSGLWPTPMVSTFGYSMNARLRGERLEAAKLVVRYLTSPEVQLLFAERLWVLPSRRDVFHDLERQGEAWFVASRDQYRRGKKMPVVPEMRAIWDAMRPAYQNVLNGETSPLEAASVMQEAAERKILEMRG